MKKTYSQIVQQIEDLKLEADKLRRQEIEGVVSRIREAVQHYGLSAEDLGLALKVPREPKLASKVAAKTRGKSPGSKGRPVRAVKFRDEAGHAWGGIGKRPQWLRDALAAGKTLQDFAVN